jgi:hypothetical protein
MSIPGCLEELPECFIQLAVEAFAYPKQRMRRGAKTRTSRYRWIARYVRKIADLGFPIHTPDEHRDNPEFLSACRIIAQEVREGEAWVEKIWLKYRGAAEWVNEDG